jgi:ketosteroid isomerase-like protein
MTKIVQSVVLTTLCMVLIADLAVATPPSSRRAVEALLIQNEHVWAQSAITRDIATFRRLMTDDYVQLILQPATPTQKATWSSTTKDEWTELLRSGSEQYQSVELRNLHVYLQGDIATVSGEYSQKGTKNGADNSYDGVYVDIWVRRHGVWRVASSAFP